jgi:hypothetical protein
MKAADLATARGALKRSASVRSQLHGASPADRDEQLRATLASLSDAMAPINAELRSGPLTGRSLRNPDARAMSEALQAERAKVRGMLRRASGGPKQRIPYRRDQFRAAIGDIVRRTNAAESELTHSLPQMRPGSQEYRHEAERLLATVDRLQHRLSARRAQARYWSNAGAWGRITKRDRALAATALETADRLRKLRQRANAAVAVPIALGIAAKRPQRPKAAPAKRRRWTENDAWAALVSFTRAEGRPPKASDFPGNADLPSYAKVHALFGGLPDAGDLLYDARNS